MTGRPSPHHRAGRATRRSMSAKRSFTPVVHWPFLLVLAAGTGLRVVVWLAYQPALFYSDSTDYLGNTFRLPNAGWHPPGYPLFLDVFLVDRHLAVVTAVQHLMVLLDAVMLYFLLLRLRCGRWLATLAVTPILLDAYQLQIEQYILSEALFQTLVTAAVVAALWPRSRRAGSRSAPVGAGRAAVVGLCFGLATFTRTDGLGFAVPLLAWLVWVAVAGRRHRTRPSLSWPGQVARGAIPIVTAAVMLGVPLAALTAINGAGNGARITNTGPDWLYGRVAGFANCAADDIPAAWRPLCPTQPLSRRPDPNWFESNNRSPERRWQRAHRDMAIVQKFAVRVIEHQPLDYAAAVAGNFADQFLPTRDRAAGTPPVAAWLFRTTLRPVDPTKPQPAALVDRYGRGRARIDLPLARFLRDYQHWAYLPGPLIAAALLLGLVTVVVRRSDPRAPGLLLLLGTAVFSVLTATAFVLFSWRYILPTLFLYPPAAALCWAMLRQPKATRGGPDEPARSQRISGAIAA